MARSSPKSGWILFLVAGVMMFLAGAAHPRPSTEGLSFNETLTDMFSRDWRLGHVPGLVAMLLIGGCVVWLAAQRRAGRIDIPGTLLAIAGVASVLAIGEMFVHIFADADAAAFARGDDAPLVDLHFFLQALYMPIFGLAFAILCVWGAKGGRLAHPVVGALGAAGAISFGVVGPAAAVYESTKLGVLFLGAQALAVWFVWTGVTQLSRERRAAPRVQRSAGPGRPREALRERP